MVSVAPTGNNSRHVRSRPVLKLAARRLPEMARIRTGAGAGAAAVTAPATLELVNPAASAARTPVDTGLIKDPVLRQFMEYTKTFGKKYNSPAEYGLRLGYFKDNMKRMQLLQSSSPNARFAPDYMSDYSPSELSAMVGRKTAAPLVAQTCLSGGVTADLSKFTAESAPAAFDWRYTPLPLLTASRTRASVARAGPSRRWLPSKLPTPLSTTYFCRSPSRRLSIAQLLVSTSPHTVLSATKVAMVAGRGAR